MTNLSVDDIRPFFDLAFERMLNASERLGCDVNGLPDLDGANSVFQLVTHCDAMARWWLDHAVLGNPTQRDRPSEFTASGSPDELEALVSRFRSELDTLLPAVLATISPAMVQPDDHDGGWPWTTNAIVLHVIEELFQHAGHVDITCDLVLRGRSAGPS